MFPDISRLHIAEDGGHAARPPTPMGRPMPPPYSEHIPHNLNITVNASTASITIIAADPAQVASLAHRAANPRVQGIVHDAARVDVLPAPATPRHQAERRLPASPRRGAVLPPDARMRRDLEIERALAALAEEQEHRAPVDEILPVPANAAPEVVPPPAAEHVEPYVDERCMYHTGSYIVYTADDFIVEHFDDPDLHHRGKWYVVSTGTKVGVWKSYTRMAKYVNGKRGALDESAPTRDAAMRLYSELKDDGQVEVLPS